MDTRAPGWMEQVHRITSAIDRPAHAAVQMGRGSWTPVAATALTGLTSLAVVTLLVGAMHPLRGSMVRLDALRAVAEALFVALPALVVLTSFARLQLAPRVLVGALAVGLLTAGVVALGLVPMMAYIAAVSREQLPVLASPMLLVPAIGLLSVVTVVKRVVLALDDSLEARAIVIFFTVAVLGAFAFRASGLLQGAGGAR